MTQAEMTALAILRSGGSYEDAAKASGLTLDHVMRLMEQPMNEGSHDDGR